MLSFYSNVIKNFTESSNYYDFINTYVTNENYYKLTERISRNLYIVISGNSDNRYLTNDYNLHFSLVYLTKSTVSFLYLDSNLDGKVSTNDMMYNFIRDITNLSEPNSSLPNEFLFFGKDIENSMKVYFREASECLNSLKFISNKLSSSSNSIEVPSIQCF